MAVRNISTPSCYTAVENDDRSNASNKRIGVCKDCGYQWYGRSKSAAKPSRCPECRSHECAWKDELTPEELSRIAPKLHGLVGTLKPDDQRIITLKEVKPSSPPANRKGKGAKMNTVPVFIPTNNPAYLLPAPEPDEEEEPTAPATIDIPGVAENVPLIPLKLKDEDDEDSAPFVAWENKKGEIEYAALVNPETLDELDGLKAKVQELETAAPVVTMQDVDILKQAGLIDDADPDKEEDEDMELNETAPLAEVKETENPAPKTKPKKGGISKAGLITIAAIAVVLLILTYIPILKKAKNAQDKAAVEDIMFGNSSFRGSNMLRNLSKLSNPLRG